jgi:hypothetical protein
LKALSDGRLRENCPKIGLRPVNASFTTNFVAAATDPPKFGRLTQGHGLSGGIAIV